MSESLELNEVGVPRLPIHIEKETLLLLRSGHDFYEAESADIGDISPENDVFFGVQELRTATDVIESGFPSLPRNRIELVRG